MQLTRTRLWVGGAGLAALALTAGSWFGLVAPRHDEAAALREQTLSVAQQNDVIVTRIAGLETQLADLPARRAEAAALREQLPAQADLPSLIRQLSALADRSGATLVGVTPTEPAAAAVGAAPATSTTVAPDSAAVDASATAADTAATAQPGGLQTVPVAVTATGTFAQVQELLRLVQTELPRAVLVKDVSMTSADAGVDLAVTADVFVLPPLAQEEQPTAATAPAPAPAAAPAPTPAPAVDGAATVDAAGTSTQEPT